MREMSSSEIRELAEDIEVELRRLARLETQTQQVRAEIERDPARAALFYENMALKLHHFYTGCERIFQIVASELNSGLPSSYDWHRRLLDRMSAEREGRPAMVTVETAGRLQEYLAFRHVVRNIYGFELDPLRVERLVADYPSVWHQFETQARDFVNWLRALADQLEAGNRTKQN